MKKLAVIILSFMISIPSAFADVSGFAIGIQANENQINNRATEDIDSNKDATVTSGYEKAILDTVVNLSDDFDAAALFAEYTAISDLGGRLEQIPLPGGIKVGLTIGVALMPDADVKQRSLSQTSSTSGASSVPNVGTNSVKYSVEDHTTLYGNAGLVFNNGNTMLYGTLGAAKADVNATSKNVSSDDFTNTQTLEGIMGGVGIKHAFNVWNMFVKLDYQQVDYDQLKYVTSNNTTVTADLDTRTGAFSIGRTF
jgi:hypothetical protein